MQVNPDPARITDEMWRLWTDRPNPTWKLGGIYANKKGYHNTVVANKAHWNPNYSIRVPLDLVNFNKIYARAIDLTMSDSEMVKWTKNMRDSALNPSDTRLEAVREFYGTLDNETVYGLIKDSTTKEWRRSSSDKSHLWHGHMGIFTSFVKNWHMLGPILSVWAGESFAEWSNLGMFLPKLGDTGETVKYWQYVHNVTRKTVTPNPPVIKVDGDYGKDSAAAFADFWKKSGGDGPFSGSLITGWLALKYHQALAVVSVPASAPSGTILEDKLKELVEDWLDRTLPDTFNIEGTVKGKMRL